MTSDRDYPKAKLGRHLDMPAVIITDRKGEPFLRFEATSHWLALKRGISFCDAALADHAARAATNEEPAAPCLGEDPPVS